MLACLRVHSFMPRTMSSSPLLPAPPALPRHYEYCAIRRPWRSAVFPERKKGPSCTSSASLNACSASKTPSVHRLGRLAHAQLGCSRTLPAVTNRRWSAQPGRAAPAALAAALHSRRAAPAACAARPWPLGTPACARPPASGVRRVRPSHVPRLCRMKLSLTLHQAQQPHRTSPLRALAPPWPHYLAGSPTASAHAQAWVEPLHRSQPASLVRAREPPREQARPAVMRRQPAAPPTAAAASGWGWLFGPPRGGAGECPRNPPLLQQAHAAPRAPHLRCASAHPAGNPALPPHPSPPPPPLRRVLAAPARASYRQRAAVAPSLPPALWLPKACMPGVGQQPAGQGWGGQDVAPHSWPAPAQRCLPRPHPARRRSRFRTCEVPPS